VIEDTQRTIYTLSIIFIGRFKKEKGKKKKIKGGRKGGRRSLIPSPLIIKIDV